MQRFILLCLALILPMAAWAAPAPQSPAILAEIERAEADIAKAIATADIAGLWAARRALNAASLAADLAATRPEASDVPCMSLRTRLADAAGALITAIAADTLSGPDAAEARDAMRKEAQDAVAGYVDRRAACASAAGNTMPSPLIAAIATLPVAPVTARALPQAEHDAAMIAALSGLARAEAALSAALDGAALAPPHQGFRDGIEALARFGRAQAEIGVIKGRGLACRRLGGALFNLFDMAAAAIDMRLAQGARFDLSRWTDASLSFDAARAEAAALKARCAGEIGWREGAVFAIPAGLLSKVRAP
jgi:hypothetical protein